jgi:hypothetical protein
LSSAFYENLFPQCEQLGAYLHVFIEIASLYLEQTLTTVFQPNDHIEKPPPVLVAGGGDAEAVGIDIGICPDQQIAIVFVDQGHDLASLVADNWQMEALGDVRFQIMVAHYARVYQDIIACQKVNVVDYVLVGYEQNLYVMLGRSFFEQVKILALVVHNDSKPEMLA